MQERPGQPRTGRQVDRQTMLLAFSNLVASRAGGGDLRPAIA